MTIYIQYTDYFQRQFLSDTPMEYEVCNPDFPVSIKSIWKPQPVKLNYRDLPLTDNVPGCPNGPIYTQQAVEALRELIEPYGELLPIKLRGVKLFFYNITNGLYALNHEQTVMDGALESTPNGQRWRGHVEKYAFFPDVVRNQVIFKECSTIKSPVYVTDKYVQACIDAKLTGFIFQRVWSEESGSIHRQLRDIYPPANQTNKQDE